MHLILFTKTTKTYALNLTKTNMLAYYEKHGMPFRDDSFVQQWDSADNFGIRYLTDDRVVGYLKGLQTEPEGSKIMVEGTPE